MAEGLERFSDFFYYFSEKYWPVSLILFPLVLCLRYTHFLVWNDVIGTCLYCYYGR